MSEVPSGSTHVSFEQFYYESKDRVFRAVLASVGDDFDAEDCTAEAFARALTQWETVAEMSSPAAWVTRTATNLHIDKYRRNQRHLKLIPRLAADESYTFSDSSVDAKLLLAIRQLPERQRQVIAFRILLDLSSTETANEMGLSVGAVGTHLHRALAALRSHLSNCSEVKAK
jgi:RNA polymerase sigma factor (sigma-70 family)